MRFSFAIVGMLLGAAVTSSATAQVIHYQNNFETAPLNSIAAGPGGYVVANDAAPGWQIQGGTGDPNTVALTAAVAANGVGDSLALSGSWDTTLALATGWTWNQYTTFGHPLVPGNNPANLIRISLDLRIDGSTTNDPLDVVYQFTGGEKVFHPTVLNGAYKRVSFTLNQATYASGSNTEFSAATAFNLQVRHGAGGFGFDADNVVRLDNIVVETIPANADFDGNGAVDGNDFVIWQRGVGTTPVAEAWLSGDSNGDLLIDEVDLANWQAQYAVGAPPTVLMVSSVPEPAAGALAAIGGLALLRWRRR